MSTEASLVQSTRRQGVADLLRRTALRLPSKAAVRAIGTAWTYREIYDLSVRVARGLAELGLELGDRVAVIARNSPIFACACDMRWRRAASFSCPSTPCWAPTRLHSCCVTPAQESYASTGSLQMSANWPPRKATHGVTFVWMHDEDPPFQDMKSFRALANAPPELPAPVDARSLLQIMYTSGTESLPKGVMLSHEAVISQYVSCLIDCEIAESDVMLHAMPLFHCAQLDVFLGPSIYVGAKT
jgi:fatty-acyl-CoA synthase